MYRKSMALAIAMSGLMGIGAHHAQVVERNSSVEADFNSRRGKARSYSSKRSNAAALKRASRKARNIAKRAAK